ncbi:MAG: hypothetical protein O7I42_15630 [Alphaproteobacteria bacterium]|nr:hypothetical protein [Alphaproteobacteria bacterium]
MHLLLYLFALAAIAAALGLSIRDLEPGVAPGLDVLESVVREHGLLVVGGVILAGLGRVLQHLRAIDVGLGRVAKAAEDAITMDG